MSVGSVILLEAHNESRRIYEDTLRGAGFDVTSVTACDDAFDAATHEVPSLIVASFDANTRATCLTLCERLKTDTRTRTVPIILASVSIDAADLRSAMHASVLALTLPALDGAKLLSAIRGVMAVDERRPLQSVPTQPEDHGISRLA